ncbi:similar to Sept9 [Actinidia rufa]|uniref:Similar to Sept9 n=1 Tax=Actinidia rufa TaxID=165716 RepID=A0A7J0FP59_9ERIC|nr:similar to Sept9 [Actinidia rufa]
MDNDYQRPVSVRVSRRAERNHQHQQSKDALDGFLFSGKIASRLPNEDYLEKGFYSFGSGWGNLVDDAHSHSICNRDSKVFIMLDTMGLVPKQQHRCPVADDPDKVVIPKRWTPSKVVQHLSYFMEDEVGNNGSQSPPLFGGHQSWSQRDESFKLKSTMKDENQIQESFSLLLLLCMRDSAYTYIRAHDIWGGCTVVSCEVVVQKWLRKTSNTPRAVGLWLHPAFFDGYDIPHQPSYISPRSQKLFCFLMVVDEISIDFLKENVTVREDNDGGQWVGIWRLILLKHPPYDEPRRNGKVPKILTHRLFPQAQYSIWIDGKMELIVDPLLILERYLWRGKHTFAIAQHKHHHSIYEEADANKRRKRYARPLIDLHMKIYRYEGMKPWSPNKKTASDVPEGAIIVPRTYALNNLFSCLWFNEVNLFTPRDQLSFGYVVYRLGGLFKFFMFPNCEYNSIFVLHPHTREHSSKVEWVKSLDEFKGNNIGLKESRGGLGLWTPYPGNLDSVVLPPVARTSKAG